MTRLVVVAMAVLIASCSAADTSSDGPADSTTSSSSARTDRSTSTSERPSTSAPAVSVVATERSSLPAPGYVLVGTTQIDGAFRNDHGALVVTMTGMAWGTRACEAMYEATLTDVTTGVVEIFRSTDIRPGEECPDVGHRHVLTVAGDTRTVGDAIVGAIDGSSIDVVKGTERLRPTWWSDRRTLPSCGTDDDRQSPEINASSRACFREAYDAQRPAEIEVISFGDEGDSVHRLIRILSSEQFEILEELQPPAHPLQPPLSPWQWQSFRCRSLEFLNDPGSDVDGRVTPATDCISTQHDW